MRAAEAVRDGTASAMVSAGNTGATMASAEFDDTIEEKRPTVQVGDPFTEKRLMEATLELMQTEYLYPEVADRRTAGEWEETGREDVAELAHRKVREILAGHYPEYIDRAADRRIRDRFPIRLAPADMRPGNGRW